MFIKHSTGKIDSVYDNKEEAEKDTKKKANVEKEEKKEDKEDEEGM